VQSSIGIFLRQALLRRKAFSGPHLGLIVLALVAYVFVLNSLTSNDNDWVSYVSFATGTLAGSAILNLIASLEVGTLKDELVSISRQKIALLALSVFVILHTYFVLHASPELLYILFSLACGYILNYPQAPANSSHYSAPVVYCSFC